MLPLTVTVEVRPPSLPPFLPLEPSLRLSAVDLATDIKEDKWGDV